jgi:glycolate oxidase iron-sulfur subunit
LAISALARDVSEIIAEIGLAHASAPRPLIVAYHSACSLQHGQSVRQTPIDLLRAAGFTVREPPEGHICCGSAGTYNLLQPEIANRLRTRKAANIALTSPDVVATGNIGCITQLEPATGVPVIHIVELLDWATGGPLPARMGADAC